MRVNNKGFMMAEVIIVSAVILVTLGTVFISYNRLFTAYNSRVGYFDTVTLYRLGYYRDILLENAALNIAMDRAKNENVISVYRDKNHNGNLVNLSSTTELSKYEHDTVFMIYNGKAKKINSNILANEGVNPTFEDYIAFLSSSTDLSDTNYVMLMERCNEKTSDEETRKNDCKYAYLKLYDGLE